MTLCLMKNNNQLEIIAFSISQKRRLVNESSSNQDAHSEVGTHWQLQ